MEILTSLLQFWDSEHAGIISKIVASASYDTLKKHIDFKPLFSKIGKMFSSAEKAETFVKEICERQGTGSLGQDINKLYTEVSGDQAPSDLFPILSDWAKEISRISKTSMIFLQAKPLALLLEAKQLEETSI